MADDITELLDAWAGGDASAIDRLAPVVYPQLRALAHSSLRRGARPITMQTTAVVNELFVRLLTKRPARLESRRHFYALAAKMMRTALIDHYREQRAHKRGGEHERVPLHDDVAWIDANSEDLMAFEQAMSELEQLDRQLAELFGMRFLLGCTSQETAALSGLSKATVDRKVKLARGWLYQRLRGSGLPEDPA